MLSLIVKKLSYYSLITLKGCSGHLYVTLKIILTVHTRYVFEGIIL